MHKSEDSDNKYKSGAVCRGSQNIIYAWAMDAPKLVLPKGCFSSYKLMIYY
jgi:hypothetical protein